MCVTDRNEHTQVTIRTYVDIRVAAFITLCLNWANCRETHANNCFYFSFKRHVQNANIDSFYLFIKLDLVKFEA